jgi:hypothetical protein
MAQGNTVPFSSASVSVAFKDRVDPSAAISVKVSAELSAAASPADAPTSPFKDRASRSAGQDLPVLASKKPRFKTASACESTSWPMWNHPFAFRSSKAW